MNMKRLINIVFLSLCISIAKVNSIVAFQLQVSSPTITAGQCSYLTITSTTDLSDFSSFQLDLVLPESFSFPSQLISDEDSAFVERCDGESLGIIINGKNGIFRMDEENHFLGHSIISKVLDKGRRMRIVVFSNTDTKFADDTFLTLRVLLSVNSSAKPGDYDVRISNAKFASAVPLGENKTSGVTLPEISVACKVPSPDVHYYLTLRNNYDTWVVPVNASIPEGLKVFKCENVNGDVLLLTEVDEILANIPYVVKGLRGETYKVSGIPSQDKIIKNNVSSMKYI